MIEDTVAAFASGHYGPLAVVMILIFILGFFLEWIEISYIVLPLFAPIIAGLDFRLGLTSGAPVPWFPLLVAINLQPRFLPPHLGYAPFFPPGRHQPAPH